MTIRWTFSAQGESYTVPINPDKMGSVFPERAISTRPTLRGPVLAFEGNTVPAAWEFSGTILNADHYEALRHWVYDIKQRVTISDHYGRQLVVILHAFAPEPGRSGHYYWRHTYTVKATLISASAPTVP